MMTECLRDGLPLATAITRLEMRLRKPKTGVT